MGERFDKATKHVRENPMLAGVGALMVLLSSGNVATLYTNLHELASVATEDYVTQQISAHEARENIRFKVADSKVDRIQAFTEIVPQLKDLLTLRCMGTRNLDATIEKLEEEFKTLAGEPYREPPCERLVLQR